MDRRPVGAEGEYRWQRVARYLHAIGPARWALAAVFGGYLVLLVGIGIASPGTLRKLALPPLPPDFIDLQAVTSAWDCTRQGIDVFLQNPCDLYDRPANWPRLWLVPAFLGLGHESTFALGLVVDALFLAAALAIVPSRAPPVEVAVYGLALCSPTVVHAIAGANVDLLLFAMVVSAVLLLRRGLLGGVASHALLLLAAMLKLFPIFGVIVLVRQRRRVVLSAGIAVLAAFGVYALLTLDDIRMIARMVPQPQTFSYGIRHVTEWINGRPEVFVDPGMPSRGISNGLLSDGGLGLWLILLVLGVALCFRGWLGPMVRPEREDDDAIRDLDLFYAGAGIYIGTYVLFLNYDYRLVFLLLTVPALLRWARRRGVIAAVTLLALIGTLWLEGPVEYVPGIGWLFRQWNSLTSVAPFHEPLRAVAFAQLILFASLVTFLVALIPTLALPQWAMSARCWGRGDRTSNRSVSGTPSTSSTCDTPQDGSEYH